MKKLVLICALAFTLPALAADSPFAGTWKLDPSKSHLTGDTFTYSKAPNGMMHYDDGANSNDFGIDGKEYPLPNGHTTTWTANSDHSWTSVNKFNGTVIGTAQRELSADGKTYTIHAVGKRADGTPYDETIVYTRVSGTSGLIGKWRNTKYTQQESSTMVISFPSPGVIKWEYIEDKGSFTGKTDGSDLPYTSPTLSGNFTISVKMEGPRKLSNITKHDGKPIQYGTDTVSADGKTITDVSWTPGKESEKQTGIYIKQ
jgi:hypothetical protein